MESTIVHRGFIRIVEKMESTIAHLGFIGIAEKKMETTIFDNGKENGNYRDCRDYIGFILGHTGVGVLTDYSNISDTPVLDHSADNPPYRFPDPTPA